MSPNPNFQLAAEIQVAGPLTQDKIVANCMTTHLCACRFSREQSNRESQTKKKGGSRNEGHVHVD